MDNTKINDLFRYEHWLPEFDFEKESQAECYANMFDQLESELLYALIRKTKPLHIMELGVDKGWTSNVILKACKKNRKGHIMSFDIEDKSSKLNCKQRTFVLGDARETTPPYIDKCDFLFIDCDHAEDFAEWYCENLLTRYRGGYIWIHDWYGFNSTRGEPIVVRNSEIFIYSLHPVINLWDFTDEQQSPSQILYK